MLLQYKKEHNFERFTCLIKCVYQQVFFNAFVGVKIKIFNFFYIIWAREGV